MVRSCNGAPAPDADRTPEDYTGCVARMQLRRDIDSEAVILELTTENSGIVLDGAWLRLKLTPEQTSAFVFGDIEPAWRNAVGHVEVVRPTGEVERQYELTFDLSQESTR